MLWQSIRPQPTYHHEIIRQMYAGDEVRLYMLERSLAGGMLIPLLKLAWVWRFYLGPALTLPLLMALFTMRPDSSRRQMSKRARFLLLSCGLVLAALVLETFYAPHYASPATAVILALVLLAMRSMQHWRWRGKPAGLFMTRAVPVICVVMFVLRAGAGPLHIPLARHYIPAWYQAGPKSFGRAEMLSRLEQLSGHQLVIVRYAPGRNPFEEWVYNEADIDKAKVVWARDMSPAENEELIHYFKDRKVWLLEADEKPPRLAPYPIPVAP